MMTISASISATLPAAVSWSSQAWNGAKFCALAEGTDQGATSANGLAWSSMYMPGAYSWQDVAWNGSIFCAVSMVGAVCATSADGVTWTVHAMPADLSWFAIRWNGAVFCAIAIGTDNCATSPDGVTWTLRALPAALAWFCIAWTGTVFCVLANDSASCATSADGVTWTAHTLPVSSAEWSLTAAGSKLLAVGVAGTYASINDGVTWAAVTGANVPAAMLICVSEASPLSLLAVAPEGSAVRASIDGGDTWTMEGSISVSWIDGLISVGPNFYALDSGTVNAIKFTGPVLIPPMEFGDLSLPIRIAVVPPGFLSGVQSVCVGAGGNAAQWAALVKIDGVDLSAQVIGEIRIDAEEGAARIAEFTLRPPGGTVLNLPAWTGLPVVIEVADNSTGTVRYAMPLFSGVIDTPALNQPARTISLRCTDDLQGRVEGMSRAVLSSLIGGYTSPVVFDAAASGWAFAQDQLSTVPASLDISAEGALRLTPWASKEAADIVLDETLLGDGSLAPQIADRAGLTNEVLLEFDYRFPRIKAEGYPLTFEYVDLTSFATHVSSGDYFLQRAQVEAAISGAGGNIESITYTPLPTGIIAVGAGYWSPGPYDDTLCMGFSAVVSFDYAQKIEEQHRISVRNQVSIDAIGLRRETIGGALEGVYPDITAAETSIRLYKNDVIGIPPADVASVTSGKTTSANVSLTPDSNRAAANAAMETLIAIGKVRIWASHRGNGVSATVPLIPALDVDKTVQIDADGVLAKGKCAHVTHRLSTDTGEATSEFSIALCSVAGVGITHDEDPTSAPAGTSPGTTDLLGAPGIVFNNGLTEDHTITITFPGVEAAERNGAQVLLPSVVAAPLLEDVFTVTI